jgi:hypothetical protein
MTTLIEARKGEGCDGELRGESERKRKKGMVFGSVDLHT